MVFERIKINSSIEKRILTGSIVSTEFLNKIAPVFNKEYIESTFIRKTLEWTIDYYNQYGNAPCASIKDIYIAQRKGLKDEEAEIIETLLNDILSGYVEGNFNDEYVIDQAVTFFKERELTITANNIKYYLDKGNVEQAEIEIENYRKVTKPSLEVNGFIADEKAIEETFANSEDAELFKLPRSLGKFMGGFERGWLIGVSAPFKKGKCIEENQCILMQNGQYLPVKEIVAKQLTEIVTYDETKGVFKPGKIIDWFNNGEKEVVRIMTRTGKEVDITRNHPLLTEQGWVSLRHLEIGDKIAVPRILNFFGSKDLEDYKVKVLAYLLTDGGISTNSSTFTKQEDLIRQDFIDSVDQFGDSCSDYNEITMGISGGNINKWLKEIGVSRSKSINKIIPDIVFELRKEKLRLFLQTLFTCDGSIYKTKSSYEISYSSGSKKLLYQVSHLLLRFGIVPNIRYKSAVCNGKQFPHWILELKNKEYVSKYCEEIGFLTGKKQKIGETALLELPNIPNNRGLIDLFYNTHTIQKEFQKSEGSNWCPLKDTIDQSIKKKGGITRYKINQMWEQTKNPYFKKLVDSEILWDEIVSINSLGFKQTYDLTVSFHHNFVSNDILVHNTWMLGEFQKAACMTGLRVASFNLEMSLTNMRKRTYMSLTGASEKSGNTIFPCFDCQKNQYGRCEMEERTNRKKIPQMFDPRSKYRACTYCRDNGLDDFEMGLWQEQIDVPRLDYFNVKRHITALQKIGKANIWLECMPRFSASVGDIERKLDNLEYLYNFIPDVLLIDYADILKSDDPHLKGVEKEDDVWMSIARMASVRNCCTIVPTQLNKDSLDAKQIKTSHTSKWIGKLGHVDAMYALNQTPAEKEMNIMRVSCLEHRHKDFSETDNCYVLQKYSSGQAHLDSYWHDKKGIS